MFPLLAPNPLFTNAPQSPAKSPYMTSSPYAKPAGAQVRSISGTATVTATNRKGSSKFPPAGPSGGVGAPSMTVNAASPPPDTAGEGVAGGEEVEASIATIATGEAAAPLHPEAGEAETEAAEI